MPNFTGLWTSRQQLQAVGNGTWPGLPLFTFTTFTFTNASATGQNGPTLGQCQTAYAGQTWLTEYFTVSPQGFQQWTVPVTGNYTIDIAGAPGGGKTTGPGARNPAGQGRRISQTIALNQNDVLVMVVGQSGVQGQYAGGGGGGTFVIRSGSVLIAAGGGAGDGYYGNDDQRGADAQDVLVGNPSTGGAGGASGGGGGGGGFGGDGADGGATSSPGFGGKGYSSNFVGGNAFSSPTNGNGGFGGGGGAGGGLAANAGGGGGGYAGGVGCNGGTPFSTSTVGVGGSCYVATGSPTYVGYNSSQGFITITKV